MEELILEPWSQVRLREGRGQLIPLSQVKNQHETKSKSHLGLFSSWNTVLVN